MRAFINGKLSLSAAEGLADMINGKSAAEVRAGSLLYSGRLTEEARSVQGELTDILAKIGADVDYPEEDIERTELPDIGVRLKALAQRLRALAARYDGGKKIKNGVSVAICGKPNAGKSSLLNALLGYDKAIVSSAAGTTRDVVEGELELGGVRFNFYDTAGIREQAGEIEKLGISRARQTLSSADLALIVYEGDYGRGEEEIERSCRCPVIKVRNKRDIGDRSDGVGDIFISALTGRGDRGAQSYDEGACAPLGLGRRGVHNRGEALPRSIARGRFARKRFRGDRRVSRRHSFGGYKRGVGRPRRNYGRNCHRRDYKYNIFQILRGQIDYVLSPPNLVYTSHYFVAFTGAVIYP